MSRAPSNNTHFTHPPHPQQQPVYYPPAGPQIAHPPPPPHYQQDAGMYGYDRNAAAVSGAARQVWNGGDHAGMYGAPSHAGPSRSAESYAYAQPPQPHRSSPSNTSLRGGQSSANAWSSVHPSSASMSGRPESANRGAVKLEDLVSQDRAVRPTTGRVPSSKAAPGFTSIPLTSVKSSDSMRQGGASGSAAGGGGGDGAGGQSGPSEFIKKLYRMLEDESAMYGKGRPAGAKREQGAKRGSVGWGRGGSSFVVWDMNEFTTKVLPQTFRHSNFSSFVRQLNKYGFSKIKHVDEDTGQIKDNVWEFQHPNFQAGGKSDLDSIKRKAVVPKKSGGGSAGANASNAMDEDETSPRGLSADDANRLNEMENRVMTLEDQLSKALDEVREARSREMGIMNVVRDVIVHLATVEKESAGSSRDADPTPRIMHLFQHFDRVAAGTPRIPSMPPPSFGQPPFPLPAQPTSMPFNYPVRLPPVPAVPPPQLATSFPPMSSVPSGVNYAHSQASPHTDGGGSGSRNGDGPSPAGSKASQHRGSISQLIQEQPPAEENAEMTAPAPPQPETQNQTLYDGEPLGMTPIFADTPAWLTDDTLAAMPIYHRRSTDGAAMRIMMEALAPAQTNTVRFEEPTQDPLDTTPASNAQETPVPVASVSAIQDGTQNDDAVVAEAAGANAVVQQSPFGTLVLPNGNDTTARAPAVEGSAIRLRRSTTIKPHWTQTPRILVVEDDVVYRQLSSKFLEKFGCITETVEDAQGAVEKMNATKYDLVLMDIFFGPSMDGRKATSLIRQFDIYTPIISMTSNVQTQDVNSYLQSGMNDVLAKPFTKNGLFGILDKHLTHLKLIQLSAQVPRSLGLPPLSDDGIANAVATSAAQWIQSDAAPRNPLAAMGWSDDTYQIVLQQFMATGAMPDADAITDGSINAINALNTMTVGGAIGTSVVFGDSSGFNRKRSIETLEDEWSPTPGSMGVTPVMGMNNGVVPNGLAVPVPVGDRSAKKVKK